MLANAFPKPRAASFMQMKPIEFKTCESCHDDPHKGNLGPACASCHSEVDWKLIKSNKGQDASFHDKTRFPLRGGHVGVACRNCHGPFPGVAARFKGLAFAACSDCHEDAHWASCGRSLPPKWPRATGAIRSTRSTPAAMNWSSTRPPSSRSTAPTRRSPAAAATTSTRVWRRASRPRFTGCCARATPGGSASRSCIPRSRRSPAAAATRTCTTASSPRGSWGARARACAARGRRARARGDACATCHETTSFTDLTFDHDKDSRFP